MAEVVTINPTNDAVLDNTPPQDLAAEQSVLGAMLMSRDALSDAAEVLKGRDFYRPAHELIFDAIVTLYGRGEPADPITVAAELTKRGELTRVGGAIYLHDLLSAVSISANAGYYAEIVREKSILRRLVNASIKISQLGYQGQGDVEEIVDQAQQTLFEVTEDQISNDYEPLSSLLPPTIDEMEAIERNENMWGVPTGFAGLDQMTNGFHAGQMIIIGARPGVGKSTLALDFARSAAIHNDLCTVFFSLEMAKTELVMKLLSAEAGIPLYKIRSGQLNDVEWAKVTSQIVALQDKPLFIDDTANMTIMEIRSKARRLKQQNNLKLIVLDYIQLMTSSKKVESRQLEVSEISRQIKLLAKELEVPVIALSQLKRVSADRTVNTPQISDLRESGSLEQDADIVMLIDRPELQDVENRELKGEAHLYVAKHRNGETGAVELTFMGQYSKFTNPITPTNLANTQY